MIGNNEIISEGKLGKGKEHSTGAAISNATRRKKGIGGKARYPIVFDTSIIHNFNL